MTVLDNGTSMPLCQEHLDLAREHVVGLAIAAASCGVCDFTRRLLRLPEPLALRGLPTDNLWKIQVFGDGTKPKHVRVLRRSTILLLLSAQYGPMEWIASPDVRIYGDVEFDIPEGMKVVVWREENDFNVMIEMCRGMAPHRVALNPVVRKQKVIR